MNSERPAIDQLVDDLFRRASADLVAGLVRILGVQAWQLAEDVVQEALGRALRLWPFQGVPDRPRAWLFRVARNLAIDHLRQDGLLAASEDDILAWEVAPEAPPGSELGDDSLHLMFLCCHPALPADAHVALTLKAVCGFGVSEIARALLVQESTVAQRLVRAKRKLREQPPDFGLPPEHELEERLASVLAVIYLLFNEGYTAHRGQDLIRDDCMREALRLIEGLCAHPQLQRPEAYALAALISFHAARSPARTTADGGLLVLEQQDRSRWETQLLHHGFRRLKQAGEGERISLYHLEAGIAAQHAASPDFASTNWPAIVELYELLLRHTSSPVPRISHAVAVAQARGPAAGLEQLERLGEPPELRGYHLLHATRAALLVELGQLEAAASSYRAALSCRCSDPERTFLEQRLDSVLGST